jgi:hypothetical protein
MDIMKARTVAVAHSLLHISRSNATPAAAAIWATSVGFIKHIERASLEAHVQHFQDNFSLIAATLTNLVTHPAQIRAWQRGEPEEAAALTDLHLLLDNMCNQLEVLDQPQALALVEDAPLVPGAPDFVGPHAAAVAPAPAAANADNEAAPGAAGPAAAAELGPVTPPAAVAEHAPLMAPQPAQPVPANGIYHIDPADVDESMLGPADQRYTVGQSVLLFGRCNLASNGKLYFPNVGVQGTVVAIPLLRSRGTGAGSFIYRAYHVQLDGQQLILECTHNNMQARTLGKRTSRSSGASPQQQQQQRKRGPNTANRDRAAAAGSGGLSGDESSGGSNRNASDAENESEAEFLG